MKTKISLSLVCVGVIFTIGAGNALTAILGIGMLIAGVAIDFKEYLNYE